MNTQTSLYRLTPIAVAVAFVAACSSTPAPSPRVAGVTTPVYAPKFTPTLASLTTAKVMVAKDAPVFADPAARLTKLQPRTNPLSMNAKASEIAPNSDGVNEQINEKLNESLYQQLIKDAKKAKDPGTAAAYLRVAQRLKTNPANSSADQVEQQILERNVAFYQDLIDRMPAAEARAEIYYELAKNYDLLGKKDQSMAALNTLATKYPNSPHLTEVNFRLAEDAFASNRFLVAADYYGKVIADTKSDFREQSLYKRGWALYRASDFDSALPVFFEYAEKIWVKPKKTKQEEDALQNSLDVISLCFVQMEGAKSADSYFAKVGEKFYESIVYGNLAKIYVSKKLYSDAAETYAAFLNRHPFDPSAPELSTAIINTYDLGGFPSKVIEAKEAFVRHYDTRSAFWKQSDDATRTKLRPILEGHIVDLAKHFHALGQIDNSVEAYQRAAYFYRTHLELKPKEEDAIVVNQLLAEALYSAKDYKAAITEFEKTAYDYSNNPKAAESAYFALLSYQEWDASLGADDTARKAITPARAASIFKYAEKFPQDSNISKVTQGLIQFVYEHYKDYDDSTKQLSKDLEAHVFKFAAGHPQDKNTALMLQGMTNLYLGYKDYDSAVRSAQTLLAINPPVDTALRLEAAGVVADAYFDQGKLDEADKAYQQVLAFNIPEAKLKTRYQDRLGTTYYRQAEKLRDEKKPVEAAELFLKASAVAGDAKLKSTADFDAATVLLNGEKFSEAIPVLTAFRDKYPDSPLSQDIPEKLALAYEKTDNLGGAAKQYETMAARDQAKNPAAAYEALWQAAAIYEKAKDTDSALRVYKQYSTNPNTPIESRAEANYKLYGIYQQRAQVPAATEALQRLAQLYDKQSDKASPRVKYLGALAHFKLTQPLYDSFAAIQLKQPLKPNLLAKKKAMQTALTAYNKVAAIGVAEYTTAANYQQAQIYQKFAADLKGSERPKGMNELELEQYGILLEEQAEPLADKAIDIYTANANLVKEQVYDQYVQQSFNALAELSPGRYKKNELIETAIDAIY